MIPPRRAPRPARRCPVRAGSRLVALSSACAPAARPPATALDRDFADLLGGAAPSPRPGQAAWREARARLDALRREAEGAGARTLRVRLALREPRSGHVLEARGAVAIAPAPSGGAEGALRMILLGPGGTTALDLWTRGDRFRFAIPAVDLLKRGDATTPRAALRGLPVEFLRWWLLRPAAGDLLWHGRAGATDDFVLRDGDAIIELRLAEGGLVGARRTTWAAAPSQPPRPVDEEIVMAGRVGCGTVRYAQASTGLLVTITCEGEERDRAPDPRAFVDPDALPGGAS
ncbi:MAG: hypothetical protein IT372_28130 [Polyangiaceae bacterium]|nr:hypothetical protein [Polyangiaceae bacterium]